MGTHESRNSTPGCITHRNVYVCSSEDSSEKLCTWLSKTETTQMSFHVEWVSELWTAHSMDYSTECNEKATAMHNSKTESLRQNVE